MPLKLVEREAVHNNKELNVNFVILGQGVRLRLPPTKVKTHSALVDPIPTISWNKLNQIGDYTMFTATISINEFDSSERFESLEKAREYVRSHNCDDYEITDGDKSYPLVAPTLN